MSGPMPPDSPPPEVPEEFAATYRAAYERALAAQPGGAGESDRAGETGETGGAGGAVERAEPADQEPSAPDEDDRAGRGEGRLRDSRWFVPALLAGLVIVLVLGAYAVGRAFTDRVADGSRPGAEPSLAISEGGASTRPAPVTRQPAATGAWTGKIVPLTRVRASGSCTSAPARDSGGAVVTYGAAHLTDGRADTTWRCDGTAVGQKLILDLGRRVPVAQVGLIPGYAKTDAASGVDRYAENNRVTRVRWSIGQRQVEQTLSSSTKDRSLRVLRVPRTTTDRVTLEILKVEQGPRDTTAISEISLARAG